MKKSHLFFAATILAFAGCSKDNTPAPVNEEELITTVIVEFTDNSGNTARFSYRDLDGTGPDTAVVVSDTLLANTSYTASAIFLNESVNPAEDITEEIEEEGVDHQIFYTLSSALNLSFAYADVDANQKPIGLLTTFTTGDASSGQLMLTLRHEPNKSASGVAEGNIENAGGETDVEVSFDVTIE